MGKVFIPRIGLRAILCAAVTLALWSSGSSPAQAQQTGTVQGLVLDATTQQPVVGAQVSIEGTGLGGLTTAQGRYLLLNVPAGTHTLHVELIGYTPVSRQVTVSAGQTATANVSMDPGAIRMREIVATGVSGGAMERGKVPFTVSRVTAEEMPVQAANPLSQLQGKVPGANIAAFSGRPGQAPAVILRGPTSINASGRSQEPLYVVDGVVLTGSIADINPADIESVEIVKGAAASTLFGSRAASGVISITTKRGTGAVDGVRFTARSEVGVNSIERDFGIARFHPYLMDESGTRFCVLDAYGSSNVCSRTINYLEEQARINEAPGDFALATVGFPIDPGATTPGPQLTRVFLANKWPGNNYNAVAQIVDPKPTTRNDFTTSGRFGATTFFASGGHVREEGSIMGLKGYERFSGRVNLGHRIGEDWQVDVTGFASRATHDGTDQEEGGTGFFRLTRTPAVVDVTKRDQFGRLYIRTNLAAGGTQNENPLYSFENRVREDVRWRLLGGTTVRYTPVAWLESDANFNLDRLNLNFMQFENRGFRTTNNNPTTNQGLIFNGVNNSQSFNTSAGVLIRPQLFDWVNSRFHARWLYEQQDTDNRLLQGRFLRVAEITNAQNVTAQQILRSSRTNTEQMSVSAGTFLDVLDRYTFDFAVRRDGNSRFGEDNRWQTYGRASAAWLMARESWFPTNDAVTTFTLRGSYGTAGNAPPFAAQYEVYDLGDGGVLSAATLGNPKLRPEVVTEVEVGGDIELFNRWGLSLTYANSLSVDQILPVPVAVATGFPRQWQNAGDLRNKTWEAALTLPVIQGDNLSWSSRVNYTSNRVLVEKLNVPPFNIGTALQATSTVMRVTEGERLGTFYGRKFMTSCSELPAEFQSQCGGAGSAFQKNQDGWLVWVGEGNNPGMGITDNLWGAVLDGSQAPHGVKTFWGMPMLIRDEKGAPAILPLGHALPDWRMGWSNTVQYRGFSLYGLVEGAFGQSVWNQARHWSYLDLLAGEIDAGSKSVEDAKPIGYYWRAGPGTGGSTGTGGLYDILGPTNNTMEDASFVKLREVAASYRVGRISNFGDWTVSVVGRNLKTWTDYRGFDPEIGVGTVANDSGSGLINAIDAFSFPQYRTVSFVLSTSF